MRKILKFKKENRRKKPNNKNNITNTKIDRSSVRTEDLYKSYTEQKYFH